MIVVFAGMDTPPFATCIVIILPVASMEKFVAVAAVIPQAMTFPVLPLIVTEEICLIVPDPVQVNNVEAAAFAACPATHKILKVYSP
jgi:hypothetical protein